MTGSVSMPLINHDEKTIPTIYSRETLLILLLVLLDGRGDIQSGQDKLQRNDEGGDQNDGNQHCLAGRDAQTEDSDIPKGEAVEEDPKDAAQRLS